MPEGDSPEHEMCLSEDMLIFSRNPGVDGLHSPSARVVGFKSLS